MKRRMRPIAHPRHDAVFHRIDVTILDVTGIVRIVSNQMLPKSPLPYASLGPLSANGGETLVLRQSLRKSRLGQSPTNREIGVVWRQCPDGMNMIRQDDHSVDFKRVTLLSRARCLAQSVNLVDKKRTTALQQGYCEEPASTGNQGATIIWHCASLADCGGLRFACAGRPARSRWCKSTAMKE
jgi:hypothetical protein